MSMSAKELHGNWMDVDDTNRAILANDPDNGNLIERALSLLAAVEDGDELVRELTGFTPGPWEWNGDNQLWGGERGNSGPMEEVLMAADDGKDYGMHCAIVRHHWDAKVAEANRRLIAAAPALLARITADAQEKAALKGALKISDESGRQLGRMFSKEKADRKIIEAQRDALKAELASVKANAEAMAKDMSASHKLWNAPSLLAYRAAHPKE